MKCEAHWRVVGRGDVDIDEMHSERNISGTAVVDVTPFILGPVQREGFWLLKSQFTRWRNGRNSPVSFPNLNRGFYDEVTHRHQ
jgi:hypothetical protein